MGTFYFPVTLRKPEGEEQADLKLLVDTGATYTWIPEDILEELGLTPSLTRRVKLADGQILARGGAIVLITIGEETLPTLCLFGTRGSEPLLGAVTLEEFGLGVDPVGKTLIPVVGHLAGLSDLKQIIVADTISHAARYKMVVPPCPVGVIKACRKKGKA